MKMITLKNGQILMFWHTDIGDAKEETLKLTGNNMFLAEKEPDSERGYRVYNFATTLNAYQEYLVNRSDINVFHVKNGILESTVKNYRDLHTQ